MLKRVLSGIIFALIAFAAIWFGDIIWTCAVIVCAAIGIKEYCGAFKKKGFRPMMTVMAAGLFSMYFSYCFASGEYSEAVTLRWTALLIIFELMLTLTILVLMHKKYTPLDAAASVFGTLYIVGFLNFFILVRGIGTPDTGWFGRRGEGFYWLILAVLAAAMADTFALFVGKAFGKRKLIPAVSPHKTVAGSIGAIAGAAISATVYGLILIKTHTLECAWYHFLIIGFIIGIISQIGDLCASSMKRFCGVKDFGKLIPGHGGILDRLDSHMFIMPFVYFYIVFFVI